MQFNCQKHFYLKAIQFSQTVLIQTIQFSIIIVFVYTQLNVKTILFQTIQFSFSTQFISIRPIDSILSGAATPGQSGPVSVVNEGVLCISQSSSITRTSPSDCLVSYPGPLLGWVLTSLLMQSVYFATPANWAISLFKGVNNPYELFKAKLWLISV